MWGARDLGSLSHRLGRVWSTESWNMIKIAKHNQNISKIKVKKLEHTWAICFQQLKTPSRTGVWLWCPSFGGITIQNLCIWWGLPGFHLVLNQLIISVSFRSASQDSARAANHGAVSHRCPLCWLIAMSRWFGLGQLHSCSLLKWQFVVIPEDKPILFELCRLSMWA